MKSLHISNLDRIEEQAQELALILGICKPTPVIFQLADLLVFMRIPFFDLYLSGASSSPQFHSLCCADVVDHNFCMFTSYECVLKCIASKLFISMGSCFDCTYTCMIHWTSSSLWHQLQEVLQAVTIQRMIKRHMFSVEIIIMHRQTTVGNFHL
jgi:hypothetical protein